jgi:plastocyanin
MRRALAVVAVGFVAFAACGGDDNGTEATTQCEDRTGAMQALVLLEDNVFGDECTEMTTAQGFEITNRGSNLHNLSIEGVAMIDLDVQPGETNNTESPGLDAGTYTMFCKYHRAGGMEAGLRIIEE